MPNEGVRETDRLNGLPVETDAPGAHRFDAIRAAVARRAATVLNLAVVRLAAVLVVLVAFWVGFDTSAAQTPTAAVLVSNIDQETSTVLAFDLVGFDLAQPFTTGGNSDGYQVTSVEINVNSVSGSSADIDVGIWTSTSAGRPGTLVGELTDPTTLLGDVNTFTTTGIDLSASTTYVLVLRAANGFTVRLSQTESSDEDSTSAAGWTIADNHLDRTLVNNPDSEWTSRDATLLEIRINGTITNAPTNHEAEGRPTISGFAVEGKTLTASTSAITDENGLTGVSYSYQWYRRVGSSDTAIDGATGSRYTLVAADGGTNRVLVCVDFHDDAGFAERKCSRSEKIDRLPIGSPVITGAAQVGQTLRVSTSGISDPDPEDMPLEVIGIFWTRVDGSGDQGSDPIVGTGSSYTLTAAEEGYRVELEVNLIALTESENTYNIFMLYPPRPATVRAEGVNNSPVLSSTALTREVTENAVPGTDVGLPVTATDADVGDPLSYSLEGTDRSSFEIDASTGQIRTKSGVTYDFEADASYAVTVKVDDSVGGTDTVAVAISLIDVDDRPDTLAAPSVSTTEDSTTSLDVDWVEPPNLLKPAITSYDLRYRVGGDGDWSDGPQDVVGTSAVISGLAEATGYQVQVQATSSGGVGGWSASGVGYTGRSVNTAPVFSESSVTREVAENTPVGGAVGDPIPAAVDAQGDPVTYTLEGDQAFGLAFDASTRQISSLVVFDHEVQTSYVVRVRAEDVYGASSTLVVVVTVTDVEEPPRYKWATVQHQRLVLTFDEALDAGSAPAAGRFEVKVTRSGAAALRAVTRVEIDGAAAVLTLAAPVRSTDRVTVRYLGPASETSPALQDPQGNEVAVFGPRWVEVIPADTAGPVLELKTLTEASLVLGYDEALDESSVPAVGAYVVTVDGSAATVSGVAVSGAAVTLTLAAPARPGQAVRVRYIVPASNPVRDAAGNPAAAIDPAEPVHNATGGNRAPQFVGVSSNPPPGFHIARQVIENSPGGVAVGEPIHATDPNGDELTWSITRFERTITDGDGNIIRTEVIEKYSSADFTIDEDTGQIRTKPGVDYEYEARRHYFVEVQVTDSAGALARTDVLIEVTRQPEPQEPHEPQDPTPGQLGPTVTSVTLVTGPGENGTWDVGETVTAEVTFSAPVTFPGAPTLGISLGGTRRDATYASMTLRFSYTVTADDAGANQARLVANSLHTSTGIIGDNGQHAILDFDTQAILDFDTQAILDFDTQAILDFDTQAILDFDTQAILDFDTQATTRTNEGAQQVETPNSPAAGQPTITGTAERGRTLTASTSDITDADGLVGAAFAYQWLRNPGTGAVAISGASTSTYPLVDADAGNQISVRVSFTDDNGNDEAATSTEVYIQEPPPLYGAFDNVPASHDGKTAFAFQMYFSAEPSLDFEEVQNNVLSVTEGDVTAVRKTNPQSDTPNIRWEITVEPSGTDAVTVTLPPTADCDDDGAVCTTDGTMLSTQASIAVPGPTMANTAATGQPTITGSTQVGSALIASTSGISDANGTGNATFEYQWLRSATAIPGATNSTYTVATADEGHSINVRVSFTDDDGFSETLTSAGLDIPTAPLGPVRNLVYRA